MVFDFKMDPDTIEAMTLSRLLTWITLGNDLFKERNKR